MNVKLASNICRNTHVQKKYATLRQLKFQKNIPMLYLQGKISKLEFEAQMHPRKSIERKTILNKLAPLYAQLMDLWRRKNNY